MRQDIIMDEEKNNENHVINIIHEALDSFGGITYSSSGELRRNNKLFGLILGKELYLRITPKFFFFYPPETYNYYELKFRKFKLKEFIDRDDLLRKIYKAYLIAYEDGPYRFDNLQD